MDGNNQGLVSITAGVDGKMNKFLFTNNPTVREVLAKANLNPDGHKIRVGGQEVGLDHVLKSGQAVLLLKATSGNEPSSR